MAISISYNRLNYLNDDPDVAWYAQYGCPSQACFYPGLRKTRNRVAARLIAKGVDLKDFPRSVYVDFDGTIRYPSMHKWSSTQ